MAVLKYSLVIIILLIVVWPLYWMVQGSFQDSQGLMKMPPNIVPGEVSLSNYARLWRGRSEIYGGETYVLRWFVNSCVMVAVGVPISIGMSILAGYAFSIFEFPGRKLIFMLFMAALMLHTYMLIIPIYVVVSKLHLPTVLRVTLPMAFNPFGIFFAKNYIDKIPHSLVDIARVEGVGELRIATQLYVPMCKPLIGLLTLFQGLGIFGDYLWQMLNLHRIEDKTLPVGLILRVREMDIWDFNPLGLGLAAGTILFGIMVAIFAATSKYFTEGLNLGGVKE